MAERLKRLAPFGLALGVIWLAGAILGTQTTVHPEGLAVFLTQLQIPAAILSVSFLALLVTRRDEAAGFAERIDTAQATRADRRISAVVISALVVLGALMRVADLDEFGLSVDEAIFTYTASLPTLAEVFDNLLDNAHPPANFVMLHYLLKFSWGSVWLRVGSLVGGASLIWLTFILIRRISGTIAGLLAAMIIAFSPNLILLSRTVRNHSPGVAFLMAAVYFFVRFMQEDRWRFFYLFALFEVISGLWYYGFVITFLGMNVTLGVVLVVRRAPPRDWARVVLAQLPLAALFVWAIIYHVPRMATFHLIDYMHLEYEDTIKYFWYPLLSLSRYVAADWPGFVLYVAWGLGLIALCVRRRWWLALLCVSQLPFAFALAVTGRLPFGGTRHSLHSLAFLLIPAAALLPEALNGFASLKRDFTAWRAKKAGSPQRDQTGETGEAGEAVRRYGSLPGWLCGAGMTIACLHASLALYGWNEPYRVENIDPYRGGIPYYNPKFFKVREAPTLNRNIDLVQAALERHAGPGDIVLLSYSDVLVMKFRLDPGKPMRFTIDAPVHFSRNGVNYYYSPVTDWGFWFPAFALIAVADAVELYELETPPKIWITPAAWAYWPAESLTENMMNQFPEVVEDTSATGVSSGLLMALNGPEACRLGAAMKRRDEVMRSIGPDAVRVISKTNFEALYHFAEGTVPPSGADMEHQRLGSAGEVYYYSPQCRDGVTPQTMLRSAADVFGHYGLGESETVWLVFDPLEKPWLKRSLAELLDGLYPGIVVDQQSVAETLGLAIPLNASMAREVGARLTAEAGEPVSP